MLILRAMVLFFKEFSRTHKTKRKLVHESEREHARTANKGSAKKLKRGCAFFNRQLAGTKKKREERAFSLLALYPTGESASNRRKQQSSSHNARESQKKKIEKKKSAHYSHFLLFTLEFFASQTNKQTTTLAFLRFTRREVIYIYIYKERERERLFPSLRFDFSSRNTERDERQISHFFSSQSRRPPRKNKRKSASRRRRRRRRARREKSFFGGIKNDVGRRRSAAAEIRLEGV